MAKGSGPEPTTLRALRERRQLSLNEVGRLTDLAPSTILRLEAGAVHEPLYATAVVLGRVYGVSPATVVALTQQAFRDAQASNSDGEVVNEAGRAVGAAQPAMASA